MRRERDAERDPDSKVKRREEGRAFQREGPMVVTSLRVYTMCRDMEDYRQMVLLLYSHYVIEYNNMTPMVFALVILLLLLIGQIGLFVCLFPHTRHADVVRTAGLIPYISIPSTISTLYCPILDKTMWKYSLKT